MTKLARLASLPAAIAAVAVGVLFFGKHGTPPRAVWAWVAFAAAAPILLQFKTFRAQLLARAALWMNLLMGALWAFVAFEDDWTSLVLVAGAGGALLMLGGKGLDEPPAEARSAFVPIALRGLLVSILIMAIADTGSLFFWADVVAEKGQLSGRDLPTLIFFALAAPLMLLAVIGLLRLKTWGFLLNLAANVGIASAVWFVHMPKELGVLLTATAVGQVVVGLPVLRAMIRGDAQPSPMRRRAFAIAGSLVVVAIIVAVIVRLALRTPPCGCA